jgi:lysylphosphatidylglycerol synthetase-like protein (DUF2156 family)
MVEEHGSGKQLFRLRAWPHIPLPVVGLIVVLSLTAALAAYDEAWVVAVIVGFGALIFALAARAEYAKAMKAWKDAVRDYAQAVAPSAIEN